MGIPFNSQYALSKARRESISFPAFDPESSDLELLRSYERGRALRVWGRQHDTSINGAWASGVEALWNATVLREETWLDNWATTLEGVQAHIASALHSSAIDLSAADHLMEHGLLSLYRSDLIKTSPEKEMLQAAVEIIHLNWEMALAAYERSAKRYAAAVDLIDAVDAVERELGVESPALQALKRKIEAVEEQCSNMSEINQLMKTQAPDDEEFALKVGILLNERVDIEALSWLARDTALMNGRLDGATSPGEPIDFDAFNATLQEA